MFFRQIPPPHSFPSIFFPGLLLDLAVSGKFLLISDAVWTLYVKGIEFLSHGQGTDGLVVFFPEMNENVGEVDVFFLHFLVVTPTLLRLPRTNEKLHCLEYLVSPTHMTVDKVLVVYLQEPVVPLVLLQQPVAVVLLLQLFLTLFPSSARLLTYIRGLATSSPWGGEKIVVRRRLSFHILDFGILHLKLTKFEETMLWKIR